MAIPSGKFYQRMTIDGVTKDWDLADICECDMAGGWNGYYIEQNSSYKVINNDISYPAIPSNSACEIVDTSFAMSQVPYFIKFPKIGTLPMMFDPNDIAEDKKEKFVYYEVRGGSSFIECKITYTEANGITIVESGSGVVSTYRPNRFYKKKFPNKIIVLLQGGGGGGGDGSPQGTDPYSNGGGGGGSGACVWGIIDLSQPNSSQFLLRLHSTAQANANGAAAELLNSTSGAYIIANGGSKGGTATTGEIGSGGDGGGITQSAAGSPFKLQWFTNGAAGGDGGPSENGGRGDDMIENVAPYNKKINYGFQAIYNGGGPSRGGGGGASVFSNGGKAPEMGSTPITPGIGAGGGGGYSKISNQGNAAPGGQAYAVIYFGYSIYAQ